MKRIFSPNPEGAAQSIYPDGQSSAHSVWLLLRMIAWRSPHLLLHARRVAQLSRSLAQEAGCCPAPDALEKLEHTALIHDIGKTAVPEEILQKSEALSEDELQRVQQHTIKGFELAVSLKLEPEVSASILHHHENFDGSGYPQQRQGLDIPLYARIIRIADVFDALTSHRPYRPAYPAVEALGIMQDETASFDPSLLTAFLSAVERSPSKGWDLQGSDLQSYD
jgi:putative nucleotidyltransferase with HDIG domain